MSGYTAFIDEKDVSLKEFVFICSHAFFYDSSGTDLPKEEKVSDYHIKKIQEITSELKKIKNMSVHDAEKESQKEYTQREKYIKKYVSDKQRLYNKYQSMLKKVKNWVIPSSEYIALKKFMIEQLEESIKFDCSNYVSESNSLLSGKAWIDSKNKDLRKNLKYHKEEYKKESDRIIDKNTWIRVLRESFEGVE